MLRVQLNDFLYGHEAVRDSFVELECWSNYGIAACFFLDVEECSAVRF